MNYMETRYNLSFIRNLDYFHFRDVSTEWSSGKAGTHLRQGTRRAGSLHLDPAVSQVPDPPGNPEPQGGPLDKPAVADALDLSHDQEPSPGHFPAPALLARSPSTRTGRTEMTMIAMITAVKLSRTIGMFPKRYPARTKRPTQTIAPPTLYARKRP